jgi:putative oxidoreductase
MSLSDNSAVAGVASLVRRIIAEFDRISYGFIAMWARIFPAAVFWRSGQTKVEGWHIKDTAILLFQEEYKVPFLDPVVGAHLAAFAEHLFPPLLVLGLATRFSAFALLIMTAIIEMFVYPGAWPTHGTWAACFILLIARGAGPISLDHLIARRFASV